MDFNLNTRNYIITDLETSGLDPDQGAEIVQIAAKAIVGTSLKDHPSGEFEVIIKPEHPELASPKAIEVIGQDLWNKALKEGLDRKTALKKYLAFCESVNDAKSKSNKPMFVGHNAKFDFNFLAKVMIKDKIIENSDDVPYHYNYLCTMQMVFELFETDPDVRDYRLDTALKIFGKARASSLHDAMEDTRATAALFVRFLKTFREVRRRLKIQA